MEWRKLGRAGHFERSKVGWAHASP